MFNKLIKRREAKMEERRIANEQFKYDTVFGGKEFAAQSTMNDVRKALEKAEVIIDKIVEEIDRPKTNEEIKREFKEQRRLRKLAEEKAKQETPLLSKPADIENKQKELNPTTRKYMENLLAADANENSSVVLNEESRRHIKNILNIHDDEEEVDEIEAIVRLAYQMQDEDIDDDEEDCSVL